MKQIAAIMFSPTGGTKKIVTTVAQSIAGRLGLPVTEVDLTNPSARAQTLCFSEDTLVVLGLPTYAGRIPNKILPDLSERLYGEGKTMLVSICVYGNRNYDEALREAVLLAENNGFLPIAAAACVSAHAFSQRLAAGRPDEDDLSEIRDFGERIAKQISSGVPAVVEMDRKTPIGPYYVPLKEDGAPAKFLKARPITDEATCNRCGICANLCPMGSIDKEEVQKVDGVCIKCQACIKGCPTGAKYFDDGDFLSHVKMLEANYRERKRNLFLVGGSNGK